MTAPQVDPLFALACVSHWAKRARRALLAHPPAPERRPAYQAEIDALHALKYEAAARLVHAGVLFLDRVDAPPPSPKAAALPSGHGHAYLVGYHPDLNTVLVTLPLRDCPWARDVTPAAVAHTHRASGLGAAMRAGPTKHHVLAALAAIPDLPPEVRRTYSGLPSAREGVLAMVHARATHAAAVPRRPYHRSFPED